jgi:hypothetical protein
MRAFCLVNARWIGFQQSALAAKKAAIAANAIPERDVPLPRPRPVVKGDASNVRPHREHSREARRGGIFDLITPLMKFVH